jgi:hypothetical protein
MLLAKGEVENIQDMAQEARRILMDLVHYRTYASTLANGRKESREETITRVKEMHQMRFPELYNDIEQAFKEVYSGRVVPSMRGMQFAGLPILKSNMRLFNCSYSSLSNWKDFADLF